MLLLKDSKCDPRCGQSWFESQEVAGQLEDGSVYRPSCTWLDGNHDNEIPSAALKFSTYSYGPDTSHVTLDRDACASTIFAADEKEIKGKSHSRIPLILI